MLLRSGIGKNTFFFLSQEILKRTADAYIMSRGIYGPDSDIPAYRRFKEELYAIDAEFKDKAIKAAEQERDAEITGIIDSIKTNKIELTRLIGKAYTTDELKAAAVHFGLIKPSGKGKQQGTAKNKDKLI